jgi:hypothetical protein
LRLRRNRAILFLDDAEDVDDVLAAVALVLHDDPPLRLNPRRGQARGAAVLARSRRRARDALRVSRAHADESSRLKKRHAVRGEVQNVPPLGTQHGQRVREVDVLRDGVAVLDRDRVALDRERGGFRLELRHLPVVLRRAVCVRRKFVHRSVERGRDRALKPSRG